MRAKNLILLGLVLLGTIQVFGQEVRKEIYVNFRVGKGVLDTTYLDNAARLSEAVSFLENVKRDTTLTLVEVTFCGSASPDGSLLINRRLAKERCLALENYLREYIALPDSLITRCDDVFAWEYLARLVEESDMPHKDEAVDVLRNVPEFTYNSRGVMVDSKKKHLMELQYGRTWFYMLEHFYPKIRNAGALFVTVRQKPVAVPEPPKEDSIMQEAPPIDTVVVVQEPDTVVAEPAAKKPFYMAVKTNMLYDVLTVPNLGVEFYLGKNWSIAGNWMYSWWNSNKKHRYWRFYGGDISIRKWLGKKAAEKPLTGHHLGVIGQIFTYDFEWGGTGYIGGKPGGSLWESPNYAVGLEYGYSLPIAKRLNIDFSIAVGYWGGTYYTYKPLDDHYVWDSTKKRHWFGPTKAEISLIWLIGRGNTNNGKGGMK